MRADLAILRACRALAVVGTVALGAFGAAALEAEVAKPSLKRKMFDFTPPRPGEMLANPGRGTGSPPHLKEFAPRAASHLTQNEAGTPTANADGGRPGDDEGKSRPASAGPAVQLSNAQRILGEQIAKSGIEGFLSQPPQASSPQEQQYVESVRQQISASLANWRALYAGQEAAAPQGPPGSTAPAASAEPKR